MNSQRDQEDSPHLTSPCNPEATRALPQKSRETDNRIRAHGATPHGSQVRMSQVCMHSRGVGPLPPRSPLARLQLTRPRTSEEMQRLAVDVWRQRGLALIDPLLIADDFARQALINEANRLYGRHGAAAVAVEEVR